MKKISHSIFSHLHSSCRLRLNWRLILIGLGLVIIGNCRADDTAFQPLVDFTAADASQRFTPTGPDVTTSAALSTPGLSVQIKGGGAQAFPGVSLNPPTPNGWDLSNYGHIEAQIMNTGTALLGINMRVDNDGDWKGSPWNVENTWIKPGATATIKVTFGYSYGKLDYALKSNAISKILFFTGKKDVDQSFRIISVQAAGSAGEKPAVDPASIRIKPTNGVILGAGVTIDPAKQIESQGGAEAGMSADGQSLNITFSNAQNQFVLIKPPVGAWDFTDDFVVHFKIKNTGEKPISPSVRITSVNGATDPVAPSVPVAPGSEIILDVPFAATVPWEGIKDSVKSAWNPTPGTGTKFTSNGVKAIQILPGLGDGQQIFTVESILADAPVADTPDWLGKRPPVDGEWVQTFNEDFNGTTIDESKWRLWVENVWDTRTHFTKDNLILGDGVLKEHYEKKPGFANNDPTQKKTDYAVGYIDTYGKWRQRYGYFEARMKLPKAPGLWPAFWLMPDRGGSDPQWVRQDTAKGAMEFDIMEFQSGWGLHRYNIAMHWDGYGKDHQMTGSGTNYVQEDKDGYITSGLLWLPGSATYYVNGKEILHWESPRISNVPSIIMFDTVSGGWDNLPLDDSKLPDDFIIDYVRVWQRKDLASDVDGPMH